MRAVQQIRKKNMMDIIRIIQENDSITKGEIVEKTDLTLVTINKIVNTLLENATIIESGLAESSGGRKASLYSFNFDKCYVVGVSINVGAFWVVVADLRMRERVRRKVSVPEGKSVAEIIEMIAQAVRKAIKAASITEAQIAAMGITVEGPVNQATGTVHIMPNWQIWKDVPLGRALGSRFPFPVCVDKDMFAALLYFKVSGLLDEGRSAIYLTVGGGVGASIFVCGNVYRGRDDVAGELGHVSVEAEGRPCRCGSYGCLEAYISRYAIERCVMNRIMAGEACALPGKALADITIREIIAAARQGDAVCSQELMNAAKYLGIAFSDIVKTFNPDDIFVSCDWASAVEGLLERAVEVSRQRTTIFQPWMTVVRPVAMEDSDIGIKGAIALAIDRIMSDEEESVLLK